MPQRKHRASGWLLGKLHLLLYPLMFLCVVGIVVFSILLHRSEQEYKQGNEAYDSVKQAVEIGRNMEAEVPAGPVAGDAIGNDAGNDTGETSIPSKAPKVDFTPLWAVNEEVVGWIQAEGQGIDYPIVRGEDNEYYLDRLFNRQRNKMGSIFMDYRNNGDFSDKSTVIYGHYMNDGSMFTSILRYKKQGYYDDYPTMMLYTPEGEYTIELFAGLMHDGNYEFVRFAFDDSDDFIAYIGALKEKSTFESDVIVAPDDRIVALSTCAYDFDNARYALYGRLVPAAPDQD